MDALTFKLKRGHLGAVAFGKKALEGIEHMTPARFDLMYAIWMNIRCKFMTRGGTHFWMLQNKLRATLGLHPSTVSKMLKRLLAIGWVEIEEAPHDRRTNLITLSEAGVTAIDTAIRATLKRRVHRYFMHWLFKEVAHGEAKVSMAIASYVHLTAFIAAAFGDRSTLGYLMLFDPDH